MNILKKGLILQKHNKEITIFDSETSMLHTLNETASQIFEKMKSGLREGEIVEFIVKKYRTDKSKVEHDVKKTIQDLKEKNLITS